MDSIDKRAGSRSQPSALVWAYRLAARALLGIVLSACVYLVDVLLSSVIITTPIRSSQLAVGWVSMLLPSLGLVPLAEILRRRGRFWSTESVAFAAAFNPITVGLSGWFVVQLAYSPAEILAPYVLPSGLVAVAAIGAGIVRRSEGYTLAGAFGLLVFVIEVEQRYSALLQNREHPDAPFFPLLHSTLGLLPDQLFAFGVALVAIALALIFLRRRSLSHGGRGTLGQ